MTLDATEQDPPKVSVIMGAYNCSAYVHEAVMSIVNQTYANWELIICDDASTDGTYEILQRLAASYRDQIVLLRNDSNAQLAFTLNRCLVHCKGDFIARMDGDDIALPARIARQVDYLRQNQKVDVVGTSMQRFDERGLSSIVSAPAYPDRICLKRSVPFNHATILARRHVFEVLHYTVAPRTVRCEDKDLWFKFFEAGLTGHNMQDPLYLVREDINAIRRRTTRARLSLFRTTMRGYAALGFPLHWYATPILELLKILIPTRLFMWYRDWQKRQIFDSSPSDSNV